MTHMFKEGEFELYLWMTLGQQLLVVVLELPGRHLQAEGLPAVTGARIQELKEGI